MSVITSAQNEKIKLIRSLGNKKARKSSGLYLVEGERSVFSAPEKELREVFVSSDKEDKYADKLSRLNTPVSVVGREIFERMSFTEATQGILALCRIPGEKEISGDIILVADGVRDPGNLGTMVRSARAFGVGDIILTDCCDVFDPKAVRSTMGGVFGTNFIECTRARAVEILKSNGFTPVVTDMEGENIYGWSPKGRLALIVGSEARGVSEEFRALPGITVSIPMPGTAESLNAAVAISIALSWTAEKHSN